MSYSSRARLEDQVAPILELVSERTGIPAFALRSTERDGDVPDARAVAMYLARELTGLSYTQLAAAFGGRHHTTLLDARRRVLARPALCEQAAAIALSVGVVLG